jgi:hypothetical protein
METNRNHAAGTVVCILALAGCGGSSSPQGCSFSSGSCNPVVVTPPIPSVSITPSRQTVQVGVPATFNALTENLSHPSYAWCRSSIGDSACATLPGATGPGYTLASASLTDDGARFRVTATGPEGVVTSDFGTLAVSSLPGVVYQDGEFLESDWAVTSIVIPAQGGPTFTAVRMASGGNPGAFRSATYDLPSGQAGSVRIFYSSLSSIYDPNSKGAIHVIDFAEDCITTSLSFGPVTIPLIEQGGRRFVASKAAAGCTVNGWSTALHPSLGRDDFVLVDGPACVPGESCPDFSSAGAPIRLGLVGEAALEFPLPPTGPAIAHFAHGFDNWKVTVWRK